MSAHVMDNSQPLTKRASFVPEAPQVDEVTELIAVAV
jgi:hypothetical protein